MYKIVIQIILTTSPLRAVIFKLALTNFRFICGGGGAVRTTGPHAGGSSRGFLPVWLFPILQHIAHQVLMINLAKRNIVLEENCARILSQVSRSNF